MTKQKSKTSLPLGRACKFVAENLPTSEYLTERHSIFKGEDYVDISVAANWLSEYETISVEVEFSVQAAQHESMQAHIHNDDTKDDIDSGIGELFENALQDEFPSYDWSYPIGEILIKCRKIK